MNLQTVLSDCSQTVHFVGIGGVSMSGLAEVLLARGFSVTGSDMKESAALARLRALGIKTFVGHRAEQVAFADLVIRTSAIPDSNPEIVEAKTRNLPVLERAEAWGILMREYKHNVCFSGTHGKTTSTSMMTHIALEAELDPQVMVGANLAAICGGLRIADSDLFLAEACEYCNSFHHFYPTIAVILNVDEDHLDFFSGIDEIIVSFRKFASLIPEDGAIVVNADDENALKSVVGIDREIITFGIVSPAKVQARNLEMTARGTSFDLYFDGEFQIKICLSVLGKHNVYNALSACAAALKLGVSPTCIAEGLSTFHGAGRRFEFKGEFNGAQIYDDYAHHPSEVRATLESAKTLGYERVICVFQPHTYTRTAALKEEFASALSIADVACLVPIYAAREKNTIGIESDAIADLIPNSCCFSGFEPALEWIRKEAKAGDLILTMGAGDIVLLGEKLIEEA